MSGGDSIILVVDAVVVEVEEGVVVEMEGRVLVVVVLVLVVGAGMSGALSEVTLEVLLDPEVFRGIMPPLVAENNICRFWLVSGTTTHWVLLSGNVSQVGPKLPLPLPPFKMALKEPEEGSCGVPFGQF